MRLARFLLGLLRQRETGVVSDRETIDIGMSQGELALLLGASRPKVNAALTVLEEMDAIRRQDTLVDCNVKILMELGEFD